MYTITSNCHLKHFQRKMAPFPSMKERLKFWQQKCSYLANIQLHLKFMTYKNTEASIKSKVQFTIFQPLVKSVYKGNESLSFLESKIWDMLLHSYKVMPDLKSFKATFKKQILEIRNNLQVILTILERFIVPILVLLKYLSYLNRLKNFPFVNLNITLIYC